MGFIWPMPIFWKKTPSLRLCLRILGSENKGSWCAFGASLVRRWCVVGAFGSEDTPVHLFN